MDRRTLAGVIGRAVGSARPSADDAAATAVMATQASYLPPADLRRYAQQATEKLGALGEDLVQLMDLMTFYALLYPPAHDDSDTPGQCACGRQSDACPARQAAQAGELEWVAEDGRHYPLTSTGPRPADG